MHQDEVADLFFKIIITPCPEAVAEVLRAVADHIHVVQPENIVSEQFTYYKSLADAYRMCFCLCYVGRYVGGVHTEHRLRFYQIGGLQMLCETV